MSKFNKFADIIYEIKGTRAAIIVQERFDNTPAIFINKQFNTDGHAYFWNFVLDAVEEADQAYLDVIKNEDGESSPDDIARAKRYAEKFTQIKVALIALTQGDINQPIPLKNRK